MHFDRIRPGWSLTRRLSLAALAAGLAAGSSITALASHREAPIQIRGLITVVGNNGLQLQTSSGTVNVTLVKGITHVLRSVMGSTGDVTPGKRVELHLVKGTRTVDAIHVQENKPAPVRRTPVHSPSFHTSPKSGDRSLPHGDANGIMPQLLSGQVVTLIGGTLTLKYGNGSTGSFALGPNVNVNEALSGSLADLGVGETVRVFLGKSGSMARTIIIINA